MSVTERFEIEHDYIEECRRDEHEDGQREFEVQHVI